MDGGLRLVVDSLWHLETWAEEVVRSRAERELEVSGRASMLGEVPLEGRREVRRVEGVAGWDDVRLVNPLRLSSIELHLLDSTHLQHHSHPLEVQLPSPVGVDFSVAESV